MNKLTVPQLKAELNKKYPGEKGYLTGYSGWKKNDLIEALQGKKEVPKKRVSVSKGEKGKNSNEKSKGKNSVKEKGEKPLEKMTKAEIGKLINDEFNIKVNVTKTLKKDLISQYNSYKEGKSPVKEEKKGKKEREKKKIRLTKEDCEDFFYNPNRHPITLQRVVPGKSTSKAIFKECESFPSARFVEGELLYPYKNVEYNGKTLKNILIPSKNYLSRAKELNPFKIENDGKILKLYVQNGKVDDKGNVDFSPLELREFLVQIENKKNPYLINNTTNEEFYYVVTEYNNFIPNLNDHFYPIRDRNNILFIIGNEETNGILLFKSFHEHVNLSPQSKTPVYESIYRDISCKKEGPCVLVALSLLTNTDVNKVYDILIKNKVDEINNREGGINLGKLVKEYPKIKIIYSIKNTSSKRKPLDKLKIGGLYNYVPLRDVEKNLDKNKRYIVSVITRTNRKTGETESKHALAIIDGKIIDWSRGYNFRVNKILEVPPDFTL